jgi:hypothetical protein
VKRIFRAILAVFASVFGAATTIFALENVDFQRYQVIVDRSPFGFSASQVPAAQDTEPDFVKRYAFVGLVTVLDGQLQAIVFDKQNNKIRFTTAGETFDGVKVERIEQNPSRLVLSQGLRRATLAYEPQTPGAVAHAPTATAAATPTGERPATPARRIPFRRVQTQ